MAARKTFSQVVHLYFDTFHISDRHGNRVEVGKDLANILIRLEEIELTIEKVSPPSTKYRSELIVNVKHIGYGTIP
ncbi:hypothetical protein BH18THE2_BH18THE2_16830 [soil metagenome]